MDMLIDMGVRMYAPKGESVDIAAVKKEFAASIDLNERIRSALAAGFRSMERFSGLGSDAEVLDAAADSLARAWLAKLDKVVNKERFWEFDTLFSFQDYVGKAFVESVVEQGAQDRPDPPSGMH